MGDMIDKDAVLAILNDHVQVGSMIEAITALPAVKLGDAVALIDAEATKIAVLASGLDPRRQAALESGEEPTTFGEEMWAAGMRLRRLSAALQTEGGA